VVADTFLVRLYQDYQAAYENQLARRSLGKVILRKLILIEKDLYRLAYTDDARDLDVFENRLLTSIKDIEDILNVLQNGGIYTDIMSANFNDVNEISERIVFSRDQEQGYALEVIDLTPRLFDIEHIAIELLQVINSKFFAAAQSKQATPEEVTSLLKQADTFLLRSEENASKILYETNREIEGLEVEKTQVVRWFGIIRNATVIVATVVGVIISAITITQVSQIIEERESYAQNLLE